MFEFHCCFDFSNLVFFFTICLEISIFREQLRVELLPFASEFIIYLHLLDCSLWQLLHMFFSFLHIDSIFKYKCFIIIIFINFKHIVKGDFRLCMNFFHLTSTGRDYFCSAHVNTQKERGCSI